MTARDGWLAVDGTVVAALEVCRDRADRRRGVRGREGLTGAVWLVPCRHVHTFGVRFPLDVAFCDRDGFVLRSVTIPPRRMSPLVRGAVSVLEARAGAFDRWGLGVGVRLEAVETGPETHHSRQEAG